MINIKWEVEEIEGKCNEFYFIFFGLLMIGDLDGYI